MLSIDDALAAILAEVSPMAAEELPLDRALGRCLAAPIAAREDAPPFDASAMDGWAVRAADLRSIEVAGAPVALAIQGEESRAGGPLPEALMEAHALRIFTGAPVPAGADSVVMQEVCERRDDRVLVREPAKLGQHVRRRGEDVRAGEPLLEPGALLGSGELALAASQGIARVSVHRAPRVAILTNGDELRDVGDPARPGSIVDSNGPMLAALVREAGGEPVVIPRAPDDLAVLTSRVKDGLGHDVLLLAGGVSVGDHDLVHHALREAGVEARFWKVAIKPGKPLTFAHTEGTPVFGLPGNPVSAWVTFEIFVRPALRTMLGDRHPLRAWIDVELERDAKHPRDRTEFARASLTWRGGAPPLARLHAKQGSGSVPSIAGVDALVVLGPDRERTRAGERARAIILRASMPR